MLLPMLWLLLLPPLFDFVADVVPTIGVPLIWLLLKALLCQWQMLLLLVGCNLADVIANGNSWHNICHKIKQKWQQQQPQHWQ